MHEFDSVTMTCKRCGMTHRQYYLDIHVNEYAEMCLGEHADEEEFVRQTKDVFDQESEVRPDVVVACHQDATIRV